MNTQRNRAWRRRQTRRVIDKIQHSHLWLWNQIFLKKEKLSPKTEHLVNPKKTQFQKLHGHIQAVRESLRANDDLLDAA